MKERKEKKFEGFMSGHNACAGCGAAIAMRHLMQVAGKNTIVTIATGCIEVVSTPYPFTSWRVSCIHSAFENAAATASGISSALKNKNKKINVIAIAGDGGAYDIGLQSLSGAFERGHKFLFLCYDNEAYMNTGIQRSGATPLYAITSTTPKGKTDSIQFKKNMPFILASHNTNVYVATANIAFLEDFRRKIKKALSFDGPSYIQVLCPCPPGWRHESNATIRLARLAVETNFSPLYEIENGKLKLNYENKKAKPVKAYLTKQGRFKNLGKKEIAAIQKFVNDNYKKLKKLSGMKIF